MTEIPKFNVHLDSAEMAVRMYEAIIGDERPPGKSPRECLALMNQEIRMDLSAAAETAIKYLVEQVSRGQIETVN
jgi:hypothetical protein